ncbi:MAG: SDR family oxidoreductase [Bacteroidota bacterium]|nr:SDR family oxidoreductase [Bacteroidota bacterium]
MNIVITGGSKGMGKAIAEKFAVEGHDIFLVARGAQGLEQAAQQIGAVAGRTEIRWFAADLSEKESAIRVSQWLKGLHRVPDVLVNNAGLFVPGNIHDEAEGTLEKMISTNLYSAYHLTRRLLPEMIRRKSGHIFNMCSIASLHAYPGGGAYSISKYALMGFNQNLREELKPYGIRVTGIYPGAVHTSSWEGTGVPASRIMDSEDIALMVYAATTLTPKACVEDIILRPQLGDLP